MSYNGKDDGFFTIFDETGIILVDRKTISPSHVVVENKRYVLDCFSFFLFRRRCTVGIRARRVQNFWTRTRIRTVLLISTEFFYLNLIVAPKMQRTLFR